MSSTTPAEAALLQRMWPWVLTLLVLIGTAAANLAADPRPAAPVAVAVVLVAVAMLPAMVPRWVAGLGLPAGLSLFLTGALSAAYFALGYADGPVVLALPAVTFVVAAVSSVQQWAGWALAAVTVVCGGLAGRYLLWQPDAGHHHFWEAVGAIAIVAATGAVAAAARSRLEARAVRADRAAVEERLRMAQDLHDGVGHGLSVVAMQAGVALHVLERDPAQARASLEAIRDTSKESLDALRSELAAMSGEAGRRRPARGSADLPALVERVRGAGLDIDLVGRSDAIPASIGDLCFAVVQEGLTNVLRHAAAERVVVTVDCTEESSLVLTVADDGRGSDTDSAATGLGLASLASRVADHGGSFDAGPTDTGFRVRARLPVTEEAE